MNRNDYGALIRRSASADEQSDLLAIEEIVAEISAGTTDEHAGWNFGIDGDSKGRWTALNWDLYQIGHDPHSGALIGVVQVRRATQQDRKRRYPASVQKSYFLVGRNEDGTPFAHCVPALPARTSIAAVQNWIFGGDYSRIIRQGDIAILPVSRTMGKGTRRKAILQNSHQMTARQIKEHDGKLYARAPHIVHLPGTHPEIGGEGWFRIVLANRAAAHDFAPPTLD